jgi:hypothetical protein
MSVLKTEVEAVTESGSIRADCPKCGPLYAATLAAKLFHAQEQKKRNAVEKPVATNDHW